jgi:aryl-phospho-beta-D-glucosidase BglC (GH1 family)
MVRTLTIVSFVLVLTLSATAQRGRVVVQNGTVVADNGVLLRGDHVAMREGGQWSEADLRTMRDTHRFNAVRAVCYRLPINITGYTPHPSASWTPQQFFPYLDSIVARTKRLGMYVIIDYHTVNGLNLTENLAWWSVIAPRYKDDTHVIYEAANEPGPANGASQLTMYNNIRSHAPNTHIILWSFGIGFNNYSGFDEFNTVYTTTGISYDNASVAFHSYAYDMSHVEALRTAGYPVLMNERGYYFLSGSGWTYAQIAAAYQSESQTWENRGISWMWLKGYTFLAGETNYANGVTKFWPKDPAAVDQNVTPPPPSLPLITTHPTDKTVLEGTTATFSVMATSTLPISYQWQRNGVDISAAAGSSFTTPPTTAANSGDTYRCRVTNTEGSVMSNEALLTVLLPGNRNTDGQIILYSFEEGTGNVVNDLSGVGAPVLLMIDNTGAVHWIPGALSVNSSTVIATVGAATKLIDAVKSTNEITIEAWVKPSSISQNGPARIVTLSPDLFGRNFTLGQGVFGAASDVYDVRLRSTGTSTNGVPSLTTPAGDLVTALTHVVYTRNLPGTARIYINGVERASGSATGDLSNWDDSFRLGIANELSGDRPWLGEFHLLAFFQRALSSADVLQNYAAGPDPSTNQLPTASFTAEPASGVIPLAVSFDASASTDPDGVILSYGWNFGDGTTGSGATTSHQFTTGGSFTTTLMVTDDQGGTASAATTITAIGPPGITEHPANQIVSIGQIATFSVVATGTAPLYYQWQKNDVDIADANNSSYTTPPTTSDDNGSTYRCIITNPVGSVTSISATLLVSTVPPAFQSDDFSSPALKNCWTFINPQGTAVCSLTGSQISVSIPAGTSHDVWIGGNVAPRIMQSVSNVDFEVEVKFDQMMNTAYQIEGIIVEENASNFIRFDFVRGTSTRVFCASFVNGSPAVIADQTIAEQAELYLRVKREGNTWTQSYSLDGTAWMQATSFDRSFIMTGIGIFFGNAGGFAPAFTGLADYFLNLQQPQPAGIAVNTRAYLEGAYVSPGDTMRTGLSLPLHQPYAGVPWQYEGSESVVEIPDGVVDWILLELRAGTTADTRVGRRAAFIGKTGVIVDLDGTSQVLFDDVVRGDYYLVLNHRNHLAVMSAIPASLDIASPLYDFTTSSGQAFGTSSMKLIGSVFTMVAGDVDANGGIGASDLVSVRSVVGLTTYDANDIDLNGGIGASDLILTRSNVGALSQVP